MAQESTITLEISDRIATLTLNRPLSLNSLNAADYAYLADALRDINGNEDVAVTILQGTGRWFCAGTDVKDRDPEQAAEALGNLRKSFDTFVMGTTVHVGHALHSHSKILIAALNGPVMGIMAAFLGHFDFIYALPSTWLACPFTRLGIIAEGGASVSFVNRMGLSMAKEVLIWGKKKTAQELLAVGFLNKIYPEQPVELFHQAVRNNVLDDLAGLDLTSVLSVKSLVNVGLDEKNNMDAACLREAYAQANRFASGVPGRQFHKIAKRQPQGCLRTPRRCAMVTMDDTRFATFATLYTPRSGVRKHLESAEDGLPPLKASNHFTPSYLRCGDRDRAASDLVDKEVWDFGLPTASPQSPFWLKFKIRDSRTDIRRGQKGPKSIGPPDGATSARMISLWNTIRPPVARNHKHPARTM
ncbi:hypothetical protein NMY22_g2476 [Coprinellus aureogranulatus]|nr:hypothetical protein NMY22_g2476 [Coprinellus aureogranulatus]